MDSKLVQRQIYHQAIFFVIETLDQAFKRQI